MLPLAATLGASRRGLPLLNGGELEGVRVLSPTTVEMMSNDQLAEGVPGPGRGRGFGLDFAVVTDPFPGSVYRSDGEYSRGGAAGTGEVSRGDRITAPVPC